METIYIITGILILFFLFLLGNILAVARLIGRTKRAFQEFEEEIMKIVRVASEVINEIIRYAAYEKEIVREIARAKKQAEDAKTYEEKKESGNILSSILKSAFKVSEKYPDLKASQKFIHLKEELKEIEEGISSAKDIYEGAVSSLGKMLKKRPFFNIFSFLKKEKKEKDVVDEKPKRGKVRGSNKNKKKKI
jgi:LemA protein